MHSGPWHSVYPAMQHFFIFCLVLRKGHNASRRSDSFKITIWYAWTPFDTLELDNCFIDSIVYSHSSLTHRSLADNTSACEVTEWTISRFNCCKMPSTISSAQALPFHQSLMHLFHWSSNHSLHQSTSIKRSFHNSTQRTNTFIHTKSLYSESFCC